MVLLRHAIQAGGIASFGELGHGTPGSSTGPSAGVFVSQG